MAVLGLPYKAGRILMCREGVRDIVSGRDPSGTFYHLNPANERGGSC